MLGGHEVVDEFEPSRRRCQSWKAADFDRLLSGVYTHPLFRDQERMRPRRR